MYYFLLHLSVADVLTAFLTLLPELLRTVLGDAAFPAGDALCRAVKFAQLLAPCLR